MHMKLALAMHTTTLTRPMMQPKPSVACRRLSVCAAQGAPAPHPAAGGSRASQLFKAHRKLMQVGFTYEQARVILQITDSRAPQAAPMATLAPPLPAPVAPQQLPPLTQPLDQEQAATAAAAAAASDSRTTLLERRLQALEAGPLAQQLLGGPPADTSGAAAAPSGAGDGAAAAVSTSGAASMVIALLQRLQELEARLDAVELEAIRLAVAKQPLESISLEAFHVGEGAEGLGDMSLEAAEASVWAQRWQNADGVSARRRRRRRATRRAAGTGPLDEADRWLWHDSDDDDSDDDDVPYRQRNEGLAVVGIAFLVGWGSLVALLFSLSTDPAFMMLTD